MKETVIEIEGKATTKIIDENQRKTIKSTRRKQKPFEMSVYSVIFFFFHPWLFVQCKQCNRKKNTVPYGDTQMGLPVQRNEKSMY